MFKRVWIQPADLHGGTTYSEIHISTSVLEWCHVLRQDTSDIIKRSVARWMIQNVPTFILSFIRSHILFILFVNIKFFLGAFVKLRKATLGFILTVCLFVCPSTWNKSAPTVRIFMKVCIRVYIENLSRENSSFTKTWHE